MANKRSGKFGTYYGSYFDESVTLTTAEKKVNAKYIYQYLTAEGWTINAIAGLLGNIEHESALNPGRWQSEDVNNTSGGYGLTQWTPASKYINWCKNNNLSDPSEMDNNLKRIIYELENGEQYYKTDDYNYSFKEFSKSTKTPYELACAFAWNYERSWVVLYGSASEKQALKEKRGGSANDWFDYLSEKDIWLRTTRAGSGNKFYNNSEGGGISNCVNGSPEVAGYNVLCNCVGLAWGCFFETWYHNDVDSYNAAGGFDCRVRGDAGTLIEGCKSSSILKKYVIDDPSKKPPKGGLIVWSGSVNHVAYISDVSEDGNTITIHQSAYGGASWEDSAINGINGAWQIKTITRNNKGTNLWWYQNTGYDGATCEGFISNPGVVAVSEGGSEPDIPDEPDNPDEPVIKTKKRKGFNFLLFNRKKRMKRYG